MNNHFKIGMVAPSGSGKTSLLTSISLEMSDKLEGNMANIHFDPEDDATKRSIERAINQFKACTAGGNLFEVPCLGGTAAPSHYKFTMHIPEKVKVGFDILDYPGGKLGTADFNGEINTHINDSIALLVPISADILYELSKFDGVGNPIAIRKCIAGRNLLEIESTLKAIRDWAVRRANQHKHSILLFVPTSASTP